MSNEEKRQGMTFKQVHDILHSNNPEQIEALIFAVYSPYLEQIRELLDQFPQPTRRDLKLLAADFDAGRILRHFAFQPGQVMPISAGAKLLIKMVQNFQNETEAGGVRVSSAPDILEMWSKKNV